MDLKAVILALCLLASACEQQPSANITAAPKPPEYAININTASVDELTRIPHVGEKVAARIIEYREEHGSFRRVEHLMLIQGISDKRFRKIRSLVRVE